MRLILLPEFAVVLMSLLLQTLLIIKKTLGELNYCNEFNNWPLRISLFVAVSSIQNNPQIISLFLYFSQKSNLGSGSWQEIVFSPVDNIPPKLHIYLHLQAVFFRKPSS